VYFYSLTTGDWVPAKLDAVAVMMGRLNPIVTTVVYLMLDKNFQQSFSNIF
jgi:hypothetical protein